MLVLTRRVDQKITISHNIVVKILRVAAGHVRIGVDAPRSVRVIRGELEALVDDPPYALRRNLAAMEPEEDERV